MPRAPPTSWRPRPRPHGTLWRAGSAWAAASPPLGRLQLDLGWPSAAADGCSAHGRPARGALLLLLAAAGACPLAGSARRAHRGDHRTPVGEGGGTQRPLQGPRSGAGEARSIDAERTSIARERRGGGHHARATYHRARLEDWMIVAARRMVWRQRHREQRPAACGGSTVRGVGTAARAEARQRARRGSHVGALAWGGQTATFGRACSRRPACKRASLSAQRLPRGRKRAAER